MTIFWLSVVFIFFHSLSLFLSNWGQTERLSYFSRQFLFIPDLPWAWIRWHINPTATSNKGPPCLQLLKFSCDLSGWFVLGQSRWTSSRTNLLGWNVWQKPKYKFCMIMLMTHVSTLLRWDVKQFNFCPPTIVGPTMSVNLTPALDC